MSAKLAQVIPTVTADMIQQNTFLPDPFPSFYTFQLPGSNLDWPGLTLPPDIGGAYSTHICHANLTQGSLTYTSCESSGFRHLYEILHRCDVRSLYGRRWAGKKIFCEFVFCFSFVLLYSHRVCFCPTLRRRLQSQASLGRPDRLCRCIAQDLLSLEGHFWNQ